MPSFILRSRKGSIKADRVFSEVGKGAHIEIIAHTLANAFFYSNGMRDDVVVYVVLESSSDFPRTLKFTSKEKLSFPGFHEQAILNVIVDALEKGKNIQKGAIKKINPGIELFGFGFETLIKEIKTQAPIYILDKKGTDVRLKSLNQDGIFVLSDHMAMPKNSIKGLERQGAIKLSLGNRMLFASQCVVLIHNELDRSF